VISKKESGRKRGGPIKDRYLPTLLSQQKSKEKSGQLARASNISSHQTQIEGSTANDIGKFLIRKKIKYVK